MNSLVGYFSLDETGRILEVNLTGAALLGVERSGLVNQCMPRFVAAPCRPAFASFLERVFSDAEKQTCEAAFLRTDGTAFWANLHGTSAVSGSSPRKWCRVAVSDITSRKQAEEAQHRIEALAVANRELQQEIARRKAVEESLKDSERHQGRMLERSRRMQRQLRQLSHEVLKAQEEERKRISRELHDEVAQTLVGINVHLEALAQAATINPKGLKPKIVRTQRLVEKSLNVVHRFAHDLRPSVLDHLGLIPTLHSFMQEFAKKTGLRVSLTAFAGVEKLAIARRTVLYRVAKEALTNVARHAEASRVDASIERLPEAVRMRITDDGKSFDVERILNSGTSRRLGLIGMRERVEMVGGSFSVESAPARGTTIEVQVPFKRGATKSPRA